MKKKTIALLLLAALMLVSCGRDKKKEEAPAPAAPAAEAASPAAEAEAPQEAPEEEPAPEPVYGTSRFAGIWYEGGDPAKQAYVIRTDGKFIHINEADEFDIEGEIREGKEEIGGTEHVTLDFYNSFDELCDSLYDEGIPEPVSFRFGNGDGPEFLKADKELSGIPVPAYEYTGNDPYLPVITAYLSENCAPMYQPGDVFIPAPIVLHVDDADPKDVKVIGNFWTYLYDLYGRDLVCVSGGEMPGVFHLDTTGDTPTVTNVEIAGDGAQYARDIARFCEGYDGLKEKFFSREGHDETRLQFVKTYCEKNGLLVDAVRDFGWPQKSLADVEVLADKEPAAESGIGMPNPWVSTSDLEEACAGSGIDFNPPVDASLPGDPDAVQLSKYRYMPGTIEALYENADNKMTIRASLDQMGFALAGDYNQYSSEWEENFKGLAVSCRGDGKTANTAVFDDGEVYFSITYNPGREGEGLTSDQLNSIIMGEQASPAA